MARVWPEPMWHNLFYDLAYVAAILVLSSSFSFEYTVLNAIWIALVFSMLWSMWLVTSLVMNRMPVGPRRVWLVAVQMGFVLSAAVSAGGQVAQTVELIGVLLGGGMLSVAALVAVESRGEGSASGRVEILLLVLAAGLFASEWALPAFGFLVAWPLAIILVIRVAIRFLRDGDESAHTFTHRFGELTMIVLGESFVKVGLADDANGLNKFRIAALVLILVVITTVWWGYFGVIVRGDAGGSGRRRVMWATLHVPLHLGLVFLSVGFAKLLADSHALLHGGVAWLLLIPFVLVILSLAGLALVGSGSAGQVAAEGLTGAAVLTVVVAVLTPRFEWLNPVLATWCATVPFVGAIAFLHRRLARLLGPGPAVALAPDAAPTPSTSLEE